jgi:hypothetical protein
MLRGRLSPIGVVVGLLIGCVGSLACTGPNPAYKAGGAVDGPDGAAPDARPPDTSPPETAAPDVSPEGPAPDVAAEVQPEVASDVPQTPPDALAPLGTACTAGGTCASGNCVRGICCNTDCRDRCWSCALPAALGTCTLVPDGDDPHDDCVAEVPTTCGRNGACNGAGACAQHPAGTECRPASCTAAIETPSNLCDGSGTCVAATARSCAPLDCLGASCAMGCSGSVSCGTGYNCVGGRCIGTGALLHWRFDETSGTAAADASGNGFAGTYVGEPTLPQPSGNVPPTWFANPSSRTFGAGRTGVSMNAVDPRLVPTNGLTLSIWFRASSALAGGSDAVNLNTDVILRLTTKSIELAKRKSTTNGMIYAIAAVRDITNHLDSKWHHLAGVASSKGLDVYLDGVLRYHDVDAQPIIFRSNAVFWIGRANDALHDFSGQLDDFRFYNRALDAGEIAAIARGGN